MQARNIPVVDPFLNEEEKKAVIEVIDSRYLIEGRFTKEFENKFADFLNVKYAIACMNGTAALHLALECLNIKPGSEVITTPFTFIASSNSILFGGLIPKFVDIDPETWNIAPQKVEEAITEKTKAIMPVHIFGLPADMKALQDIAEDNELQLIEDAAQGFGAKIKGEHVGNFGDVATFSLYATKNLISGEGGIVTTNNEEFAEKIESLKNHGRTKVGGYRHVSVGFNYRMTDLAGAIASKQMDKAPLILQKRAENADHYLKILSEIQNLTTQAIPKGYTHGNYIFALNTQKNKVKPKEAIEKFKMKNITTRPIYDKLSYEQESFANINKWRWAEVVDYPNYSQVSCKTAESVSKNHFEIPIIPTLTHEEREKIKHTILAIFE